MVGKTINGRTYYYLVESARVGGKPRIASQRYLGSADQIAAAVLGADGFGAAGSGTPAPRGTRHLSFGDVAAVWGVLEQLGFARLVDGVVGVRRSTISPGTYLALAVLHRVVVGPASDLDLQAWWPTTAAERFVRPRLSPAALDHRRFWRAMDRIGVDDLRQVEAGLLPGVLRESGPDGRVLMVDIADFATYVDNADTRLAGLGLAVTLDGAVPLVSYPYQLLRPGSTPFTTVASQLADRHGQLAGAGAGAGPVTVVVDAGQSAQVDFGTRMGLHFVGSLPLGDHPDLAARPATRRRTVDHVRFPGVTALDTRARVAGTDRRVILVHSSTMRAAQARGLARDLGNATRRLDELASALRRGTLGQPRDRVAAEIARITRFRWVDRVLSTSLTGTEPGDLRLRWSVDEAAQARLAHDVFGKQLLVTDHDDWSVAEVLTAYRARYRLESTLRQILAPVVTAPSATWRWNDQRIAVHTFICVLATTVAHLMRRTAQEAGLDLSVRELFDLLAGIEETRLRYPSTGGRPRTRQLLAERDEIQERLFEVFGLQAYSPKG